MNTVDSLTAGGRSEVVEPMVVRPFFMSESPASLALKAEPKPPEKRRTSMKSAALTEHERLERRREINRNSQRRIRERRARVLEELRSQVRFCLNRFCTVMDGAKLLLVWSLSS